MRILFISDVFGRPGRRLLKECLPALIEKYSSDFVVANVENAAGGRGINEKVAKEIFELPIDCGTSGNHIWEQKDYKKVFKTYPVLRALNLKKKDDGVGFLNIKKNGLELLVVSLHGRIFMDEKGKPVSNPFHIMDEFLKKKDLPKNIIIDFHAEATAEKRALLWHLDGKISALLGTHTHVQTADEEITENGTAYISDVGMTGPHKSVIGMKIDHAVERFVKENDRSLTVAKEGVRLEAVIIDVDEKTGKAVSIERVQQKLQKI